MESKNVYITFVTDTVKDGGMARNNAFNEYFKDSDFKIYNIWNDNKIRRVFNMFHIVLFPFFKSNINVFVHLGIFTEVFPRFFLRKFLGFLFFKIWFRLLSKDNLLTIEINDLPYEQAVDLGLFIEPFYEDLEKLIFDSKLGSKYVFASKLMLEYAVEKFGINEKKCCVVLNGAPAFTSEIEHKPLVTRRPLKFVYAGTLNEGRGIDSLLELFKGSKHQLFLIGAKGEWIKEEDNIFYLGSKEETEAMEIVSKFDIGIVHYDENKFYYNLCFPTKFSFYFQCGLPVLSTNLRESFLQLDCYQMCFFKPFGDWALFLKTISIDDVRIKTQNVKYMKFMFLWDYLITEEKINVNK